MGFEDDGVDRAVGDDVDGAYGTSRGAAFDDGHDEDDEADGRLAAPLLPPDDRLWRHPSEVAPRRRLLPGPLARPGGRPRMTTVVALTSCISVLISLAVVALVGTVRNELTAEEAAAVVDVAALAERVRPAVTQVVAVGPAGEQWGSGVIYGDDGLMLTSHRVVQGAETARVLLDDGREVTGRVIGSDPATDVAVVRLHGSRFRPAVMGSLRGVKVGHPAVTIGSPTGNASGPSVHVGVVSALGQQVVDGDRTMFDMIQTDGAVAPGCAGAAVVDRSGAVIGIAAVNVAAGGSPMGYATPIDIARAVAARLVDHGPASYGWLGVEGDRPSEAQVRDMGIAGGALVKRVAEPGPAAAAGVAPADVITAVNGHPVASMAELVARLHQARPGQTVSLTVVRGSRTRTVKATLAERPA